MNKKVLSTVMAGAMLATTVAPAMAYSIHEYTPKEYKINESNRENLYKDLITTMDATRFVDGGSVYQLEIKGRTYNIDYSSKDQENANKKAIRNVIIGNDSPTEKVEPLKVGEVIKLIDRGHVKQGDKYYKNYQTDTVVYKRYEKKGESNTLKEDYDAWNNDTNNATDYPQVKTMEYNNGTLKVTLQNDKIREYHLGDNKVDFKKAVDVNKNETTDSSKVDNFKELTEKKEPKYLDAGAHNINVLMREFNANKDKYKYVKSLEWTDNGFYFEITLKDDYEFSDAKDAINDEKTMFTQSDDNKKRKYFQSSRNVPNLNEVRFNSNSKITGFKDKLEKEEYIGQAGSQVDGEVISKITIVANDVVIPDGEKPDFGELIPPQPPIVIPPTKPEEKPENKPTMEVVAGDNRYETAVEVANKTANTKEVAENGNLVLANGNALVDGLAASPLASILGKTSNVEVAPILLTKTDSLPESTKDYIKEVVSKKTTGKVKVYIVGGNAVVSEKVEKELKELGVDVVRSGGSNREETSLKVAELISENKKPYNTFVVGANGEADAMSIAPVAADREEPIIVSKNGGLSKDGVQKIADLKANATIVGGTEVVSEATEKALKDAKISTSRVAGSNRQKTNAAIIDRYAKNGLNKIIVSKDGSAKKDELVDALTSTSLAVKEDAPIVLATDKISDEQINALKNKADKGVFIYQIGYGVSNNVLETIAAKIGLLK